MQIDKKTLNKAVESKIITVDQAEQLYEFIGQQREEKPRFDMTHVLYYLGGMVAIGAMTLFMNLGWEHFGGWAIVALSLGYACIGLILTHYFSRKGFPVPAGICATFVVALTPLAVYGLQQAMGWWPDGSTYREYHRYIRYHWIFMELATLAVGAIMMWRYRYPFLQMVIAFTLWYLSMDVAVMIMEKPDYLFRALVSMWFGLAQILLAFWVDIRSRKSADYAFWLYLFGVIAFWGGLTSQQSHDEWAKLIYCCINLGMICVGVALVRRVFVVFGGIGCALYLGHLANEVFRDSWIFPFALTAIGLLLIVLGIVWQKKEKQISCFVQKILPAPVQEMVSRRLAGKHLGMEKNN